MSRIGMPQSYALSASALGFPEPSAKPYGMYLKLTKTFLPAST